MLDLFQHAGWVAWPLGLFSILALAVILERAYTLSRLKDMEDRAFMVLQLALEKGDEGMLRDATISGAPVTQIVEVLSSMRGASEETLLYASDVALAQQRGRLRRYLGTLATIGSTAPFIGLFGTVLGIMMAFRGMSDAGLNGPQMAIGISESLSATALGLLVAVPSVMAYNYYVGRVQAVMLQVQGHVTRLVPLLRHSTPEPREVAHAR